VVLLGFYAGNDIEDIREYHRWLREHRYYFYADHAQWPFFVRYAIALTDTGAYLRDTIAKRLARQTQPVALVRPVERGARVSQAIAVGGAGRASQTVAVRPPQELVLTSSYPP
jgi:hypothetical protein